MTTDGILPATALEEALDAVRERLACALRGSVLEDAAAQCRPLLQGGKMLRSRLVLRVGAAADGDRERLIRIAAAIELIHAASLLHDDVIDNGQVRRGAPAFWVERGAKAAILMGDLLVSLAVAGVQKHDPSLTTELLAALSEMCEAEAEQEMVPASVDNQWPRCTSIARRKTGTLFAFGAAACAAQPGEMRDALREAGYRIGTAYQLADDVLDASSASRESDKTLGTDHAHDRLTAVSVGDGHEIDPANEIDALREGSLEMLRPYPAFAAAWESFLREDMDAALRRFIQGRTTMEAS